MKTSQRALHGFSVVELLVSVVIGLIALMFATRLIANAETNKQSSLGGSDSMQNGMIAMFSISSDIAQAGWGINDPLLVGCNTVFSDTSNYTLATAALTAGTVQPLAAAVINSGGANSDTLSFYSGTSMSGTGMLRITADYAAGTTLNVDRVPYGFAVGDVFVVMPETLGGRCAIAQVSGLVTPAAPGQNQILFAAGAARYNSGGLGTTFTGNISRMFNLGKATSLSFHTWSVSNGFLGLRATDLTGSAGAAQTVVDNIVAIKAQYGLDTRVGAAFAPENGMQIAQWSSTMIDADGDGSIGASDFQRVAAIRVAVVARNRNPERPVGGSSCSATASAPVVFSASLPSGVTAVPITINAAVTSDTVDWHCYRYRVFENIVPIRNAGWRPTA